MYTKKFVSAFALLLILASVGVASHASAETNDGAAIQGQNQIPAGMMHKGPGELGRMGQGMRPAAFGTVTAISGNTITITSQQFKRNTEQTTNTTPPAPTTTIYTIDATNAKVNVKGTASSVSAITVGDKIMVVGTTTGTNITATMINDSVTMGGPGMMGRDGQGKPTGSMPAIPQGNGQPIVGGTVSAISGNSITITNSSGTAYTVDATSAKVTSKGNAASTVSNIAVGDSVLVQGSVNGQSVVASYIMDNGQAPVTTVGQTTSAPQSHTGFFGTIGGFFKHMFGF